jgi:iron complex outermembrane receptor protein
MEMSLEDLMDLTLTSVSKRAQPLRETAAAVHVLTSEDIRRSGATSIPQALRMVPGLMVGQNNASAWSIASRGRSFNPTFDNKLLVMIDGRSVYSAVFSGVFWEAFDIVMEDIDRIEVIRGPGTSVWGANAVNGIINIITKSSAETQGLMFSGLAGTDEAGTGTVRYGASFGGTGSYRIYGKYRHIRAFENLDGDELNDGVETGSAGFRTDLDIDRDTYVTLQGDITSGSSKNTVSFPDLSTATTVVPNAQAELLLANLLGRYTRTLGEDSSISLQTYYSRDDRDDLIYHVCLDTFDVDIQHQFSPWEDHIAQWGLGYRLITFDSGSDPMAVEFANNWRNDNLFSAFMQDEIFLADGVWVLTLGSKFEHNDQTGL